MTRIVVTGAHGQLGGAVVHELARGHEVVPLGRADLDLTHDADVRTAIARLRPDVVVNCAAYNDVDGAEDHPLDALDVNAFAVRTLAQAAAEAGAALVHYSTDFVFDGSANAPYTEQDRPNPRGVYAASKLLGEWFAADAPRAYILRVESLFGSVPPDRPPKGSLAGLLAALLEGREARAFEDRVVSPTFVVDAAWATRRLLETTAPPGLYHCVNSGFATWVEVARELARQLGVEPRIVPVRMADMTLKAARPHYCVLSNAKLAEAGIVMPPWQDAIARYLKALPNVAVPRAAG